MLELVNKPSEVVNNAKTYQSAVKQVPKVVHPTQVNCWYYFPSLGIVAPSRFIGYKGMTGQKYDYYRLRHVIARGNPKPKPGEYIDGRVTEDHLDKKGWFRRLNSNEPQYYAAKKLAQALCQPGDVRSGAKFYILTGN